MNAPIQIHRVETVRVAGLATRTTNRAEREPSTARIPAVWMQFMQEHWQNRLEQLGGVGPTMAVYLDYASDVNGEYQVVVGRELPRQRLVPASVQAVEIPAGVYFGFSFKGALPQVVSEAWQQVWTFFERSQAHRRAYTADFELYPADGSGVDIFVAVK